MIFSYYPGCTLKNKAQDLDRYARLSAEALGITLSELDEWQCCGGAYPMAKNEPGVRLSSVRALMAARERGQALLESAADMGAELLVTACPLCLYNLTKTTPADQNLPVLYFTELLAEALGVKD